MQTPNGNMERLSQGPAPARSLHRRRLARRLLRSELRAVERRDLRGKAEAARHQEVRHSSKNHAQKIKASARGRSRDASWWLRRAEADSIRAHLLAVSAELSTRAG